MTGNYKFVIQGNDILVISKLTGQTLQVIHDYKSQTEVTLPDGEKVTISDIVAENSHHNRFMHAVAYETTIGSGATNVHNHAKALGGFGELNTINPTELQYNTIQPDNSIITHYDPATGSISSDVTTNVPGCDGEGHNPGEVTGTYNGAFEDWQPNQDLGDHTESPAKLNFHFTPTDDEYVSSITINNIPDGVKIYDGLGNEVTIVNGSVTIPGADLNQIYIKPSGDSSTDFTLTYEAHITDPTQGNTATLPGTINVIVDAAADQPTSVIGSAHDSSDADSIVVTGEQVTIDVSAHFGDTVDGSEQHYLLVKIPDGWSAPEGYTVVDSSTLPNNPNIPAGMYIEIPATIDQNGTGTGSVTFVAPTNVDSSQIYNFTVVGYAHDHDSDGSLTTVNDDSYTVGNDVAVTVYNPPHISINNPTVTEPASSSDATVPLTFTVTLDHPFPVDVTVPYTIGGTATDGSDYGNTPTTGFVTIPAGQTSTTITVDVNGDDVLDGQGTTNPSSSANDETVTVTLGTPNYGSVSVSEGVGTIHDNETAPQINATGGGETVNIQVGCFDNNGETRQFIGNLLQEGVAVNPANLSGNVSGPVHMNVGYTPTATFISEGAGFQNTIGWVVLDSNGHPTEGHVIWANASASGSGGSLNAGDVASLGNIPAGSTIAFFLIPDGYGQNGGNITNGQTLYFKDGHAYTDSNYTNMLLSNGNGAVSNPVWFTESTGDNIDGKQHGIQGISADHDGYLYVGFEDLGGIGMGDNDYNDVIFKVDLGQGNYDHLGVTQIPVNVDITDSDSTNMSKAVVTAHLGDGDTLVVPASTADITVTYDSTTQTITFTGVATVAEYEALMSQVTINVGHSGANQDYWNVDTTTDRTITYTVTDGSGLDSNTSTIHFPVTVSQDGNPCVFVSDAQVTEPHDGKVAMTFTITLSDPSINTATVQWHTVDVTANAGSDYDAASGSVTFNPGQTSQTITVWVDADKVKESDETFNIVLSNPTNANINDGTGVGTIHDNFNPPVANDDYAHVDQNSTTGVNIIVVSNDTDPDNDALTVTGHTNPSHGTVTQNPDGTFTYVPAHGYYGNDTFTYTIDDGHGGTSTATVHIVVDHINSDPIAVNDEITVNENSSGNSVVVLANDSDPDHDPLTSIGVTNTAHGTITHNSDGTFTYTPNHGYVGDDTFTYQDSDGQGGTSNVATVTIHVVGHPPVANNDSYTVNENSGSNSINSINGVLHNDTDPDGDTLVVTNPGNITTQNGSVHLNADGSFTYTPNSGFIGKDSFQYTISDGHGGTSTATANIDVVGSKPVANPETVNTNEGGGTYNLMLVVDVSGSMGDDSGVNGLSRLALEQQALAQLLQSFNAPGVAVNVQIITFSDGATSSGIYSGSNSITNATSYINGLHTQNTTNYDAAITAAENSTLFNNSNGATNLVYFLSDGQPNQPSGSVGISGSEQTVWDTFLTNNHATANAVGVGEGINGSAITNLQAVDSDGQITVVTDAHTLATDLTSLLPGSVSGNVTSNDVIGSDGWAAMKVQSITVDGNVYNANSNIAGALIAKTGDTLTVKTALGGILTFNLDTGAYTYNPPAVNSDKTENIGYIIKDSNGDTASSSLTINVHNVPTISVADAQVTEPTSGTTTVAVTFTLDTVAGSSGVDLHWATANGTAIAGLDYVAAQGDIHFNAGETTKTVNVTVNSDLLVEGDETFYVNVTNPVNGQVVDGQAVVTIHDSTHEQLTVGGIHSTDVTSTGSSSGHSYHIIGGATYWDNIGSNSNSANNKDDLHGNNGQHNWLDARNGDDNLTAGNQGDVLIGGGGHDTYHGGVGNDTFVVDNDDLFNGTTAIKNVVDGGTGTDRLEFNFDLDTTKLNNTSGQQTLSHLDILDMNDGENHTLTLNYTSVNAMADGGKLIVEANTGDTVNLNNDATHTWTASGIAVGNDGHNYVHYTAGTGGNIVNVYVDEHATTHIQ